MPRSAIHSASRDRPEHRLSHWCAKLIDAVVLEPKWATAVDHSARALGGSRQAQTNWRVHQRWQGIKPSHLDWYVFQCSTGKYAQLELKIGENRPDSGQITTMQLLKERGIPTGCAWSVMDFYQLLVDAGFDLVANSADLARELDAKHRAADAAAGVKPKRRRAPRSQAKVDMRQLRQIAALQTAPLVEFEP